LILILTGTKAKQEAAELQLIRTDQRDTMTVMMMMAEVEATVVDDAASMTDAEAQAEEVAHNELVEKWKQKVPRIAPAPVKTNS